MNASSTGIAMSGLRRNRNRENQHPRQLHQQLQSHHELHGAEADPYSGLAAPTTSGLTPHRRRRYSWKLPADRIGSSLAIFGRT